MSFRVEFRNDQTGNPQEVGGSDERFNTSSRSDSRLYYISRDQGEAFTLVWNDTDCAAGDFPVYWQNTDTVRTLVIARVFLSSEEACTYKAHIVSGTAITAGALTPEPGNRVLDNTPASNCLGNSAVGGLTSDAEKGILMVPANDMRVLEFSDTVRLKQTQAFAIEYDRGTTGISQGTIVAFYETA